MKIGLLISNHGKHSDDKLGFAFADDVIQIAADMTGQDALDGRRLSNQIADAAAKRFRELADHEHKEIEDRGHDHLASSLEAGGWGTADAIYNDVVSLGEASPLKAWFDKPEVLANIRQAAGKWTRTAQHMHRDWFARHGKVGHGTELKDAPGHDPNHEHVMRWKALHDAPTPEAYRQALHEHALAQAG